MISNHNNYSRNYLGINSFLNNFTVTMSDLYETIMSDISKDSKKNTTPKDQNSKSSSNTNEQNKSDSISKDTNVKVKDSSKKTSKSSDNSMDKLINIMTTGFSDLKTLLSEQTSYDNEGYDYDYELEDDIPTMTSTPNDLFDNSYG